jgi:hypothetical protein
MVKITTTKVDDAILQIILSLVDNIISGSFTLKNSVMSFLFGGIVRRKINHKIPPFLREHNKSGASMEILPRTMRELVTTKKFT